MNTTTFLSLEEALKKRPEAPPFDFTVVDSRGDALNLRCTEVIRTVYRKYGKRGVFRVLWRGREAAAKIYCGRRALREFRRETRAYKLAHEAGLPTPELLHATEGADRRSALLLFAWLPDAISADAALTIAEHQTEKIQLAEKMLDLIVTMHHCGLQQKDCRPRNFLFCNDRLYLIDLAGVFPIRLRWTPTQNLIKTINHQPVSMHPALLQFLERKYGVKLRPRQLELRRSLDLGKKRRTAPRSNSTVFHRRDGLSAYCRNLQFESLQSIIGSADCAEVLLQTGGCRTVRIAAEHGELILHCYDRPKRLRALRPSLAWRYWLNSRLLAAGSRGDIHLPAALAGAEERRGPFRGRSWLAREPLPGESLAAATRTSPPPDSVDESLRKTFAAFYALRTLPQDLRADRFIVHQGRVFFTALEYVRYFHWRSACRRAWVVMQQAFLDNWQASHPCYERYRKMLEAIPLESPF